MLLERLDDIDWQAVRASFGPATDVPDILRALAAPDCDAEQVDELVTRLTIELTVEDTWLVEATPVALPFMLELAAGPGVVARGALLELAHNLSLTARDIRACADASGQEEQVGFADELTGVLGANDPRLMGLLGDPDALVRAWAALLLALGRRVSSTQTAIVLAVCSALARERAPLAKVAYLAALEDLGVHEPARSHLDDQSFAVRVAAALSLIRVDDASSPAFACLAEALADPAHTRERYGEAMRFRPLRLAASICSAGLSAASALLPGLLQVLLESSPYAAEATLEPLLERFFAQGAASPPTLEQAAVLHALAEHQQYFRGVSNPQALLARRNLPTTRAELQDLAEQGPPAARALLPRA
jgi:hypothetical protein